VRTPPAGRAALRPLCMALVDVPCISTRRRPTPPIHRIDPLLALANPRRAHCRAIGAQQGQQGLGRDGPAAEPILVPRATGPSSLQGPGWVILSACQFGGRRKRAARRSAKRETREARPRARRQRSALGLPVLSFDISSARRGTRGAMQGTVGRRSSALETPASILRTSSGLGLQLEACS